MTEQKYRKKLIEISLPLNAINQASSNEKAVRHRHPSTLHLWWSRKPLAACRAILFASLVDDPSSHPDQFKTLEAQEKERQRLFKIIEELVLWQNTCNDDILKSALYDVRRSIQDAPIPPIRDPFCGGGSIPLEAQRLGLQARASDLNPVAVLITKALIEIPPKFAGRPPVAPEAQRKMMESPYHGAYGLAYDIRYYAKWMYEEAKKRIGYLYPPVTLPPEYGSREATVIAWLWVRTVTCPNPACGALIPLANEWWLSKKVGRETWIEPLIDRSTLPFQIRFHIKMGAGGPPDSPKVGRGAQFKCLCCGSITSEQYVKAEGMAKRIGSRLLAIVAESKKGRVYVAPSVEDEILAQQVSSPWQPEQEMPKNARWFSPPLYGMNAYGDIFTSRQLVALTTFSDLIQEVHQRVLCDAQRIDFPGDGKPLYKHGSGALAYADSITTYLAIVLDRCADYWSSVCSWHTSGEKMRDTFALQAIPMMWDFAEANPFSSSTGSWLNAMNWVAKVIAVSPCEQSGESCMEELAAAIPHNPNEVYQRDATESINGIPCALIATDPPYYDNISYAELSDFFYVWLRRSLHAIYPDLFQTVLTPKETELVANRKRFGGSKERAQKFFEGHLSAIFRRMQAMQSKDYPMILWYAFKQTDTEVEGESTEVGHAMRSSTGWEAMLESLIQTGFMITGTWPVRTEMPNRSGGLGTNSLASSIVLICRPRQGNTTATRRQFLTELRQELPATLKILQQYGDIAPVDLAQVCLGPGMAVYSRYNQVLEADGSLLRVRTALQLINRTLDEILSEQDSEYDVETRWAIAWFEQHRMAAGIYGDADVLSKAKNTSVDTLEKIGLLESHAGKVRLFTYEDFVGRWQPQPGQKVTAWETLQRMIAALRSDGGEKSAANILLVAGVQREMVRDLAYRLYTICEKKEWSLEAQLYNNLVMDWSSVIRHIHAENSSIQQERLFDQE